MKKGRQAAPAIHRPSGPVSAAKTPMMKEPLTLTRMVPHGMDSPRRCAMTPENQNRATLPSAPPRATHKYVCTKEIFGIFGGIGRCILIIFVNLLFLV